MGLEQHLVEGDFFPSITQAEPFWVLYPILHKFWGFYSEVSGHLRVLRLSHLIFLFGSFPSLGSFFTCAHLNSDEHSSSWVLSISLYVALSPLVLCPANSNCLGLPRCPASSSLLSDSWFHLSFSSLYFSLEKSPQVSNCGNCTDHLILPCISGITCLPCLITNCLLIFVSYFFCC